MPSTEDNRGIHVVLLAGGRGTRLRPYTAVFPKPLMPLGDMPVLEILLRRLRWHGLTNITICTGHMAQLIVAFFGQGERIGVSLRYSQEHEPLGTAGPLGLLSGLSDTFLVMNGDLLTTLDFTALLRSHHQRGADATISIYRRKVTVDFGVLDVSENDYLESYHEKPTYSFDVSMGAYAFNRSVLKHMTAGERLDLPDLIARIRSAGGRVACYRSDCFWLDIGRASDYAKAQRHYERNPSLFLPDEATA